MDRVTSDDSRLLASLLRQESVGGALALAAAALALLWANLGAGSYTALQHLRLGPLSLEHWAADGALAVFFFVAGLELKREFTVGALRRPADAVVPVVAAACGVIVPAVVFTVVVLAGGGGTSDLRGWAVPSATDIAFAVAVLAVAGRGVPRRLRTFLLTLAVVDDLIAIVIIAVFYAGTIRPGWLVAAAAVAAAYGLLQRRRVHTAWVYLPLSLAAWWCLLQSGVHATVAGVALGLLTRVHADRGETASPAERLEHRLGPWSAGLAVPVFAFLSAGVPVHAGGLVGPVGLGVILGLVLGKPVGVLAGSWLAVRVAGGTALAGRRDLFGVALLTGVGFTVSLLVAGLAFADVRADDAKAAVLVGSLISATLAVLVLQVGRRARPGAAVVDGGEQR